MVLFWVCIPLMVIAIGVGVGSVLIPSLRERRRVEAEELIAHDVARPDDGAVRLAVDVDPLAAGVAHEVLVDRIEAYPHLESDDVIVARTPDDRRLLVTVPKATEAKRDAVHHLQHQLEGDEAFGDVRELPPDEQRP